MGRFGVTEGMWGVHSKPSRLPGRGQWSFHPGAQGPGHAGCLLRGREGPLARPLAHERPWAQPHSYGMVLGGAQPAGQCEISQKAPLLPASHLYSRNSHSPSPSHPPRSSVPLPGAITSPCSHILDPWIHLGGGRGRDTLPKPLAEDKSAMALPHSGGVRQQSAV